MATACINIILVTGNFGLIECSNKSEYSIHGNSPCDLYNCNKKKKLNCGTNHSYQALENGAL